MCWKKEDDFLKANFHTHTFRCKHAVGEDRDYVVKAIERGIKVLGFSDHAPYYFPDGYYSGFRMTPEEAEGYVKSLSDLREEFKDEIKIYIGYEMEYYPAYFGRAIDDIISKYECDYLILGQHFIDNEIGQTPSTKPTDDADRLKKYVDTLIEAMNTGKYFYIAHPDVLNFVGDADIYREEMTRLCLEAKRLSVPLEYNLLGVRQGRFYPVVDFWRVAADVGNDVILGCDAHSPDDMATSSDIEAGKRAVDSFGLNLIEPTEPKFFRR